MTDNKKNMTPYTRFLTGLATIDRRWIFLLMAIVTIVFMIVDYRVKIPISAPARGVYETIEALPAGARVHLSIDYGPSSAAELWPIHITMLRQLFRRKCKIICSSLWQDSPPMTEKAWNVVVPEFNDKGADLVYGRDYVNLGFKAGDRTAIASIGTSFKKTFPIDYRGNKSETLPIMQGWDDYSGIDLLVTLAVGDPGPTEYIQQAQSRYGVAMVTGCTALLAPQLYPFFQSGNLKGFLGGLAGAAEYEALNGEIGQATKGMNVQSANHVMIIMLVLIGNLAALLLKLVHTTPPRKPDDNDLDGTPPAPSTAPEEGALETVMHGWTLASPDENVSAVNAKRRKK